MTPPLNASWNGTRRVRCGTIQPLLVFTSEQSNHIVGRVTNYSPYCTRPLRSLFIDWVYIFFFYKLGNETSALQRIQNGSDWNICTVFTVPTYDSCTKCVGSPGIIHDHTPVCHPVFWAWMGWWAYNWTCFDLQALTWVIDVFGLLLTWVFVQKGTGRSMVDWCRN